MTVIDRADTREFKDAPRPATLIHRGRRLFDRPAILGLLWILPALAVTAAVKFVPLFQVAYWSFTRTTFTEPSTPITINNYARLLQEPLLRTALVNNIVLTIGVPISILIALALCGVLFSGVRGGRLFEAIYFLPFIPAVASVSVVFIYFLGDNGPVNTLLRLVAGDDAALSWLTSTGLASWSIMGIMTWKRIGLIVLLLMARLMSMNRELFEAAAVDGASWPVAFRRIAIPQLRGVIGFAALIGVIEIFSYGFGYIFVLTQGGPQNSTYTLEFLLYRTLFQRFHIGLASAIAVVIVVAVILIAIPLLRWQRRHANEL